ncbi:MAG: bifunctional (p)ppGpp synthetase/guanosine-3',5'-bis(diphosphate) 3'-pyrophosphohydrolase, partial [Myxococcaceae bacterium]|nr:bifunctional (p)ppGpp synthetase/guanosine-3',5'-bis(diphosphate) 3'-pyrophosphohydrolase [Myxococcaceae bacterium]
SGGSSSGGGVLPSLSRVTEVTRKLLGRGGRSGVTIGGVDDVLVRFGRCCNPVPGDPIAGFITRGRGVTVHTVGCEKALATDPERRVEVSWDVRGDYKRPVTLRVLTADRPGLLADISNTFSKKGVNISQANCRATGDDRAVNTFEVTISDLKQLTELMRSIESLHGVFSVERI